MTRSSILIVFLLAGMTSTCIASAPGYFEGRAKNGKVYTINLDEAQMISTANKQMQLWFPNSPSECVVVSSYYWDKIVSLVCVSKDGSPFSGTVYIPDPQGNLTCVHRCNKSIPKLFVYHSPEPD